MTERDKSVFYEVMVNRLLLESFPEEKSLFFDAESDAADVARKEKLRKKVVWHIGHSLSKRQKEVIRLYLMGKKEAEIGAILGVKQQVVNIYKRRAINRLRNKMRLRSVC
jgi:DNA-directed RNA polymerase specialized sigma subunit